MWTLPDSAIDVIARRTALFKFLIAPIVIWMAAVPALARPRGIYPVPCNDLWAAVKDTLENTTNYAIMSMNEGTQKASFFVIGDLVTYTDRIALTAREGGCAMKENFVQLGPDNEDWRQFHHRVARSLAKLQAAKPKPPEPSTGQL